MNKTAVPPESDVRNAGRVMPCAHKGARRWPDARRRKKHSLYTGEVKNGAALPALPIPSAMTSPIFWVCPKRNICGKTSAAP